eukprot:PRCOL_00004863-RA
MGASGSKSAGAGTEADASAAEVLPAAAAAAADGAVVPPAAAVAAAGDLLDDSGIEEDLFATKPRRNPLVPLGALVTTAVLCTGLYAFKTNNVKLSQKMMRMRVIAQGATVVVMAGSAMYSGQFGPWKVGTPFAASGVAAPTAAAKPGSA